jgi:hypothetical protein
MASGFLLGEILAADGLQAALSYRFLFLIHHLFLPPFFLSSHLRSRSWAALVQSPIIVDLNSSLDGLLGDFMIAEYLID